MKLVNYEGARYEGDFWYDDLNKKYHLNFRRYVCRDGNTEKSDIKDQECLVFENNEWKWNHYPSGGRVETAVLLGEEGKALLTSLYLNIKEELEKSNPEKYVEKMFESSFMDKEIEV